MTRCKLCNYPQRDEIERRIAAREITQVEAAAIIQSTPSAISRHMRNCFPRKIAEWVKPEATKEETLNVINELVRSHRNLLELYEEARAMGNVDAAIRALGEERRHLELVGKFTGQIPLNEAPQVNLFLSEFMTLKQTLIKVLSPYPDLRQKVSRALIEAEETMQ